MHALHVRLRDKILVKYATYYFVNAKSEVVKCYIISWYSITFAKSLSLCVKGKFSNAFSNENSFILKIIFKQMYL